jgi:hypothetical protein
VRLPGGRALPGGQEHHGPLHVGSDSFAAYSRDYFSAFEGTSARTEVGAA